MALVSILIFVVLGAVAFIHVLWGFGMTWPAQDGQTLSDMVVGTKDAAFMPGLLLTLIVAAGIAMAGVFALWGGGVISLWLPTWMRTASLAVLAAIFLVRGAVTYLPFGPLADTVEPFRTLDYRYFAPLILAIGLGYLMLLGSVLGTL